MGLGRAIPRCWKINRGDPVPLVHVCPADASRGMLPAVAHNEGDSKAGSGGLASPSCLLYLQQAPTRSLAAADCGPMEAVALSIYTQKHARRVTHHDSSCCHRTGDECGMSAKG